VSSAVFDASALLALLNGEPGASRVQARLPQAVIGAVNLSEVLAKLIDAGMPENAAAASVAALGLRIIDFDESLARSAAALRPATRKLGLSFGDRACLAVAHRLGCPALTADRAWNRLQLGVQVVVIR
jgi:PIN domain nuclease of toxin-antitoxin system